MPRYRLAGTDRSSRHNTRETPTIEEIKISYITKAEIRKAVRDIKSGKAAGIHSITVEVLKADVATTTNVLHKLFQNLGPTDKPYLKIGARD